MLEAAARRAVGAWAEAVDGDDAALERVASPEAASGLLYGGDATRKTRLVVRGPRVKRIRIAAVQVESVPATMTVDVELGGRRYVEDRDTASVVSGSKDGAATFTERWTLALDGPPDARGASSNRLAFRPGDASGSPFVSEISVAATAPSARFALPSDRQYLPGRHVWARIEDGIATVGVTAPLGEVLWYTPEVEYWAVDRIDVGETLATVQGRSSRTVAIGSPVRGTLVELNPLLRRAPHALLAQPYGRGWVAHLGRPLGARRGRDGLGARLPQDPRRRPRAGARVLLGGALLAPRLPPHPRRRTRPPPSRARRARSPPGPRR